MLEAPVKGVTNLENGSCSIAFSFLYYIFLPYKFM